MKWMDKFKEIFFEPVDPEEEVPAKKEVTVAKKIDLPPETKKVREEAVAVMEREVIDKTEVEEDLKPARQVIDFDDRDFKMEGGKEEAPREIKEEAHRYEERVYREPMYDPLYSEPKYQEPVYQEKKYPEQKKEVPAEPRYEKAYDGVSPIKREEIKKDYTGLYEGNDKKKEFKPSPIISPIYGVLDKNYRKEEIVTKREMRLSTATSRKLDVDSVREKAYGDLASEITASILGDEEKKEENVEPTYDHEENLLYDLNEESAPKVAKVTVGDAEEYFNELGLEYNVDYHDTTKEEEEASKPKEKVIIEEDPKEEETPKTEETKEPEEQPLEDNLFDLIDTMYKEKE